LSTHWTIIIIAINIWHYNPLWVFALSAQSLQVLLSLAVSLQFLTFSFFRSSKTPSCHHCLGLPTGLTPIGFQSSSFLAVLSWSILWICPSHLILCALINPLDYTVWQSRAAPSSHKQFNSLNAKLNPICPLLALFGAHHILHISRIRVKVFLLTTMGRAWLQTSAATYARSSLFWDVTHRRVAGPYWRFGVSCRSHL